MNFKFRCFLVCLAAVSCPNLGFSAEIEVESRHESGAVIWSELSFKGDIESGDAKNLERVIATENQIGNVASKITFTSNGGLVNEGIEIGQIIYSKRLHTRCTYPASQVPKHNLEGFSGYTVGTGTCECLSACALAWLGGLVRDGSPGFHRSFIEASPGDNLTFSKTESRISNSWLEIRRYLEKMTVPVDVIGEILSTPQTDIFDPKNDIQIHEVFKEYVNSNCLPDLSRAEYQRWDAIDVKNSSGGKLTKSETDDVLRFEQQQYDRWTCLFRLEREAQIEAQLTLN